MNKPDLAIVDRLEQAAILHRQGQTEQAAQVYQDILAQDPDHPDALHLLGVAHCQRKEFDAALPYLKAAVEHVPEFADATIHYAKALRKLDRTEEAETLLNGYLKSHSDNAEIFGELGLALRASSQEEKAITTFRRAIQLDPKQFTSQISLADLLRKQGKNNEALDHYRAAIALKPSDVAALNSLATLLKELGQHDEAVKLLQQAINTKGDFAIGHNNLGNLLLDSGKVESAIEEYRTAIARQPDFPEAWNNLGNALKEAGRLDESIDAYEESLRLRPKYAEAMSNLGNAFLEAGRHEEALACHQQAIDEKEDFAEAWNNLANVYTAIGQHQKALEAFERAVECDPSSHQAHFGRGLTRLMLGDFAEGWEDYEHRWWGSHMSRQIRPPHFSFPQWDGSPPRPGQRILVYHEQGFGDTIQFARYLSMLAMRFSEITFICQKELFRLFENAFGPTVRVIPAERSADVLKQNFDWHIPLLSLPRAFKTSPDTIPGGCPYLSPPRDVLTQWRPRIGRGPLRVGVCWSGNPSLKDNRFRSLTAETLAELASLKEIKWYSLIKDGGGDQPTLPNWNDPMADVTDFADTAGLIACLDLVISVDTSVAHLAGALGKPVWLLSRHASEWRWQWDQEKSPWYPSMRIFKQPTLGDWESVINLVNKELAKITANLRQLA